MTARASGPAVFVIAGMHRSGTSLVARVVNLLGVSLGDPAHLMEAKPDNPSGFWESRPIAAFNDDLLAELGGRWDDPMLPIDGWAMEPRFDPWLERASALIAAEFPGEQTVGWKDPRTSLLLPFWRRVVHVERVIVVVRDPREVAASLFDRDGIDAEQAADLWMKYTFVALRDAPEAVVVSYSAFFEDLGLTVARLAAALGLPRPADDVVDEVSSFFDPALRHHSNDEAASTPAMAAAAILHDTIKSGISPRLVDVVARGLREPAVTGRLRTAEALLGTRDEHIADLIAQRDVAVESMEASRARAEDAEREVVVIRQQRDLEGEALRRVEAVAARLRRRIDDAEREMIGLRKRLAEMVAP